MSDSEEKSWALAKARDEANEKIGQAISARIEVGLKETVHVLRKMVNWCPEDGYPYEDDIYGEALCEGTNEAPFCSESYLYSLIGKKDARVFLGMIDGLARAAGFTGYHDPALRGDS